MKVKTTKKDIKNSFNTIITIPHGSLQYLLIFKRPFAYSVRSLGWACDYYSINNMCICEGYAPIKTGVINVEYALCKKFDDKAKKIYNNEKISYKKKEEKIFKLLELFLVTVRGVSNE